MNIAIRVLPIILVTALAACSAPQEPTGQYDAATGQSNAAAGSTTEFVEYLFVQHAEKVTLANNTLTFEGIRDDVLFFSDRPQRIVGRETLAAFLDAWDDGADSFAEVPPNAIVSVVEQGQSFDAAVVLKDPVMIDATTLEYTVDVLEGPEQGSGDNVAVFIDGLGKPGGLFGGKRGGESELGKPGDPGSPKRGGESELGEPGGPGKRDGGFDQMVDNVSDSAVDASRKARDGFRKFSSNFSDSVDKGLDRVF